MQEAHFGVPEGHDAVDLRIVWPDGVEQRESNVRVNQRVVIQRR